MSQATANEIKTLMVEMEMPELQVRDIVDITGHSRRSVRSALNNDKRFVNKVRGDRQVWTLSSMVADSVFSLLGEMPELTTPDVAQMTEVPAYRVRRVLNSDPRFSFNEADQVWTRAM